jgi:hypothetical protein
MKSEEVAEVAALPWYRRILGVLIFLPNIMPLKSLITAEIFPWAFFYTLRKDLRLSLSFGVFLLYLFGLHIYTRRYLWSTISDIMFMKKVMINSVSPMAKRA